MTEKEMKCKLYSIYQMYWLMSRGFSLADVVSRLGRYIKAGSSLEQAFDAWAREDGFDGQKWKTFSRFCDTDLLYAPLATHLIEMAPLGEMDALEEAYFAFLDAEEPPEEDD